MGQLKHQLIDQMVRMVGEPPMSYTGDAMIDTLNAENHEDCPQCGGTRRICSVCEAAEEECQCPSFSEGAPCPYVTRHAQEGGRP